jgi:Fe-S-cluster containining protein
MNWYQNGLKFECTKCGHCCTGGPGFVWVRVEEMHRIAEFLGMRFRDFVQKYVRKVGERYSLIEKPNNDCIFFDSGCTIYPARPIQCRTFPFWKENVKNPGAWNFTAKSCEGINQGRLFSEEEIDALLLEDHLSNS